MHDGETESGSLAGALRGEEWFENAFHHGGFHAAAIVADLNQDVWRGVIARGLMLAGGDHDQPVCRADGL